MSWRTRLRTKAVLVGASVALISGVATPAPAATAATPTPRPTLKGLVLSGTCPGSTPDLKNVMVTPTTDILWLPLRFTSTETFQPLKKWILPAKVTVVEVTVVGEGLKSRHLVPFEAYVRPGGIPPLRPVTCKFQGRTKEDGDFTVEITGTVVGGGARLFGW